MTVEKVLGIETEYGIAGGPEGDPILASSLIVNAYAQFARSSIRWDFEGEHPDIDARGLRGHVQFAPVVERTVANTVLTNGARLYVDHAHPEYSAPECRTPLEATLYDVAGEEVMLEAQTQANRLLEPGDQITLYKNNSDGKGNSYGTHENYLVSRDIAFADIVRAMLPHFVSRQLLFGAGKISAETEAGLMFPRNFQLSQRAEFFEEIVGLETTMKRPIVNTRDEPHADAERFRRLHVINGDANMSQIATFVKVGSTALLLAALEEFGVDAFPTPPLDPVHAIRLFAFDLSWVDDSSPLVVVEDEEGKKHSCWEYQDELWHLAERFIDQTGGMAVAPGVETTSLMQEWRALLDGIAKDPILVADRIDWLAKYRMITGYRARHDLDWQSPKLAAIALQYHDIRPEKSLAKRAGLRQLVELVDARAAMHEPPASTRAYFRGQSVKRFPNEIRAANWDSLVFDLGDGPLHRVPMMDPIRGTRELTERLFQESATAKELLYRLNG
jgi:proteasome accessory factor A